MTSLIFGSIYLGHKGIVEHRREKQRKKNYERWEGLRDEYDEQKKITRQTRSLDIQRTGAYGGYPEVEDDNDRPILTLRDQQEANDARTGWRPQESWEESQIKRASLDTPRDYISPSTNEYANANVTGRPQPGYWSESVRRHKTGSTWDDGIPHPLRVSRRNWGEGGDGTTGSGANSIREGSVPGRSDTPRSFASGKNSMEQTSNGNLRTSMSGSRENSNTSNYSGKVDDVDIEPIESHIPGGKMAELIEFGNPSANPRTNRIVTAPARVPASIPGQTSLPTTNHFDEPVGMDEWWNRA